MMRWIAGGPACLLVCACANVPGLTPVPAALPAPPPPKPQTFESTEGSLWLGDASLSRSR